MNNIQTSPILLNQSATSTSKRVSLLRIGAQVMDVIVSIVLTSFSAIFFMWVNGKQYEFDQLQDKPR